MARSNKNKSARQRKKDARQNHYHDKKRGGQKVHEREKEAHHAAGADGENRITKVTTTQPEAKADTSGQVETHGPTMHGHVHHAAVTPQEKLSDKAAHEPQNLLPRRKQTQASTRAQSHKAVDTRSMSADKLADLVQSKEAPGDAAFKKMKNKAWARSIDMRGKQRLSLQSNVNIIAAMAYIKGTESDRPCTRCFFGLGPFKKCVVYPGTMGGACAGCHYTGQSDKCSHRLNSFTLADQKNVTKAGNASGEALANAVQARSDLNNSTFLKLQLEPRQRNIETRQTYNLLDTRRSWNAMAAMIYMKGSEQEEPCGRCSQGMGPYVKCVVAEGAGDNACAGCHYGKKTWQCSLIKKPTENLPEQFTPTTNEKPLVSVETQLKTISDDLSPPSPQIKPTKARKRKADTLGESGDDSGKILKKLRFTKRERQVMKAFDKLGKHVRKSRSLHAKLSKTGGSVESSSRDTDGQFRKLGKHINKMEEAYDMLQAFAEETGGRVKKEQGTA